jgi:hypothetical protein
MQHYETHIPTSTAPSTITTINLSIQQNLFFSVLSGTMALRLVAEMNMKR